MFFNWLIVIRLHKLTKIPPPSKFFAKKVKMMTIFYKSMGITPYILLSPLCLPSSELRPIVTLAPTK